MLYTVYCVLLYYCLGRKVKIVFHAYKNCSYYELNYISISQTCDIDLLRFHTYMNLLFVLLLTGLDGLDGLDSFLFLGMEWNSLGW